MDQWILMRGSDVSNPVLLWLHGGPGSAQMPIAHYYNGELEQAFIVVHWDQRGAGKSNPRNFDEETMSFQQYYSDAHEITRFLKERFNQDKIYLVGHSWGTQLGLALTRDYPEDYHAYIGVSQIVDPLLGHQVAYEWLVQQMEEKAIEKDLRQSEELGNPPFYDHQKFVKFIRLVDAYGGGMDENMTRLVWIALHASEYTISDYWAWLRGANRGSGPMWESSLSFNAIEEVPQLLVPVYLFSGSNDYNTPVELQEQYLQVLDAPQSKEMVRFEQSAHTPFIKEANKFNRELTRVKEETLH
ncbi:hydrolase, alpha/beta fold family [hydrocarbon metagenome]|uniref:Hydrolase, alpha/beta fold family n=1 Tax=hydrocarbon metagenome TaxID=938273 RepID=A0A0W8E8B7_9ZZZZ